MRKRRPVGFFVDDGAEDVGDGFGGIVRAATGRERWFETMLRLGAARCRWRKR